jgi:two-component system response regulator HydG
LKRAARRLGRDVRHIDPGAAQLLLSWDWPGNVRELGNAIERAVALTRFDTVVATDLPERLRARPATTAPTTTATTTTTADALLPLEEVERRHILAVLAAVGDNRGRAASILGIDPKTLYRKLRAWSERPEGPRASA